MSAPLIFSPDYYERMRRLEASSWWNAGFRDIARLLLRTVRLPRSGTVLDVGCGSGQTMLWFGSIYPRWRAVGLDVAWDGVRAAREDGSAVCLASALALPLAPRSVDLVITFDVLQHLPLQGGDRQALAEIRRVLKPGGFLLLRTNAQAYPRTPDDPRHDFHKYTPREISDRLVAAGFAVRRLSRANAVLGLAEIPRELRARRAGEGYHGLLAEVPDDRSWTRRLKRGYLRLEGTLLTRGVRLPFGRTIVALGERLPDSPPAAQ